MDVPTVAPAAAAEQQPVPPAASAWPAGAEPQAEPAQTPSAGDTEAKPTLPQTLAKLFGEGAILQQGNLNVSYRVENGAIVTVFSDPQTGREITQVPAEVLMQIAQFFDKHSGVTLDKNA